MLLRSHIAMLVSGVVLLLVVTVNAHAAEVSVRVLAAGSNKPLMAAAVCLGTSANPQQFGAHQTRSGGTTTFSGIPDSPLVLTVSKANYLGQRSTKEAALHNRVFITHLDRGGRGPRCKNSRPAGQAEPTVPELSSGIDQLRLQGFQINQGSPTTVSREITLNLQATGNPTDYRVSNNRDFNGSDWRAYEDAPRYKLSTGDGSKVLYVQVRRYNKQDGAVLESLSNTRSDSIALVTR